VRNGGLVSNGLEWTRARCWLRARYGSKAIKEMRQPIGTGGIWGAVVYKGDEEIQVEFQRAGTRRWALLKETPKGESGR